MTRAEQFTKEMIYTRSLVAQLTRISLDDQEERFFESALQWLELITGNDAMAVQQLPKLKEFWGFWKKTWLNADKAFLLHYRKCDPAMYATVYDHFHRITLDNPVMNGTSVHCDYHLLIKGIAVLR